MISLDKNRFEKDSPILYIIYFTQIYLNDFRQVGAVMKLDRQIIFKFESSN